METKDIEKVVMQQAAAAFVNGMPEDTKTELMNRAMTSVLEKTITSYEVGQAVGNRLKEDLYGYIDEYVGKPEVQAELKKTAHESVDTLFDKVIKSLRTDLLRNMKSQYMKFED